MPRLSRALGGPRLFVKRDDCTGLATGGNKTRSLEYLLGDALAQRADLVVTEGPLQSNHCRQTAAAAAKCGLECVLVLSRYGARTAAVEGNLLLDQLLGARLVLAEDPPDRKRVVARLLEELRGRGRRPYFFPTGGSNPIGALGYVRMIEELKGQADFPVDAILFASGSGGAQGGALVGTRLFDWPVPLVGISDGATKRELVEMVLDVARGTAALLGIAPPGEPIVFDDYTGGEFGVPTPEMVEAVRLVARTEGLILDPNYTGKSMAGLIDLIRRGRFRRGQNVVFLHTGGTPALFAYRDVLGEKIEGLDSPSRGGGERSG
jgi:L-cysteate sulfo-lyase